MKKSVAACLIVFLLAGCGGGGGGDTYSKTVQEMTAYINGQIADDKVKGLAIALVDDQHTVWVEGFGKADVANDIRATADTHFEIGSNSKTFAGVMIAQLDSEALFDTLGMDRTSFDSDSPARSSRHFSSFPGRG